MRKTSKILEAKPLKVKKAKMKKFNILHADGSVLNSAPIEAAAAKDILKMIVEVK